MKLSVITVSYNNRAALARTAGSLAAQTCRDFEWIVIDGGSSDGSRELLETLGKEAPDYWCSEPDGGIYQAMNKGIRRAHGDYLLFLNSGDTLRDDSVVARALPLLGDDDIIYGDAVFCKPYKERLVRYPDTFTLYHLWKAFTPCHQATFIRAALLRQSGYDEHYRIVADYRKWIEWKMEGRSFRHLPLAVCNYMLDGVSTTQRALHEQEREQVVGELYSPQLREQMEYIHWLQDGHGKGKAGRDGQTVVLTPLPVAAFRKLRLWLRRLLGQQEGKRQ